MARNRLADLPTTQIRICITLAVILATTVRYLFMANPPGELTAWLAFVGALAGIDSATIVGKRWTSDPAVIAAEAAAAPALVPVGISPAMVPAPVPPPTDPFQSAPASPAPPGSHA